MTPEEARQAAEEAMEALNAPTAGTHTVTPQDLALNAIAQLLYAMLLAAPATPTDAAMHVRMLEHDPVVEAEPVQLPPT